jgi:hypothetical protein
MSGRDATFNASPSTINAALRWAALMPGSVHRHACADPLAAVNVTAANISTRRI